jgi:predicted choloylglycine hydrolase
MTATFRFPEADHGAAWLRYVNSAPVLSVAGSPEEIGAAVGALAVRPALRMTQYPQEVLRHYCASWLHRPLLWIGKRMAKRFHPDRAAEMAAIADAAGIDRARLVLGNTLFDVKKILACSALSVEANRSATGAPLLGRNLDYPSLGYAHQYTLVTVYRPAGRLAFASVGFPGLLGALSGMNEAGLSLAVLEVFQSRLFTRRADWGGTPYALCFRALLEECRTIDEARRRLEKMRRTTIFNLAVADRQRVAVFEATPRRVRERPADADGSSVCTNHFTLDALQPLTSFNVYKTFDRLRSLRRALRTGERLGVADVHAGLHAVHQHDHTLQTMVFEPETLRLHLAAEELPSSGGPLRTVELAPLFRGAVASQPAAA